jgi:glycosyltransferase involved in cell wall biosynthesis
MNAASLMAEEGWEVTFLSAPIDGNHLELPSHPRIAVRAIPRRSSHVMGKPAYVRYAAAAADLALRLRPDVVYASDPLGAGPGLLAARLARARLVYHEHDSPAAASLRPALARARAAAARRAEVIVFPNEARARIAQAEIGFRLDRLRIVWNLPRKAELPMIAKPVAAPLLLYHHGNISPDRLPVSLIETISRLNCRLRLVGREAPGAPGYLQWLIGRVRDKGPEPLVEYCGQISRSNLPAAAAQAHIGLALIPQGSSDVNLRHMTGAANRPFDYMAAGLALLVSDRADWREMFVMPGYARACDPANSASIGAALSWFLDHEGERRHMGALGRARIEAEWNYEKAFGPVLTALASGARGIFSFASRTSGGR